MRFTANNYICLVTAVLVISVQCLFFLRNCYDRNIHELQSKVVVLSRENALIHDRHRVHQMKNDAADCINAQNFEGNTALHYAYERKDLAMVDLLVSSGANAHLQNMYGLKAMAGARPRSFLDFAAYAV